MLAINISTQICTLMLIADYIVNTFQPKNHFFKQFTVWNNLSLILYPNTHSIYFTSIFIFFIFHAALLIEDNAIHITCKKNKISKTQFHIANFIMHIAPTIYSTYQIYSHNIVKSYIITLEIYMLFMTWIISIGINYNIYNISQKTQNILLLIFFTLNTIYL